MLCSSHLFDSSAASTASILAGVLVCVVGRSAGGKFDDDRGSYMICAAISAIRQPPHDGDHVIVGDGGAGFFAM